MPKKKTTLLNRVIFLINSVFATLLFLSYFLPFISPTAIPTVAVLSLLVPFLIIINCFFLLYWLIKLKKQVFTSAVVLILGWLLASPFYKFTKKKILLNNDLKVMSYNVRVFNHYKWNKDVQTTKKMVAFIHKTSPDILAIQEYYNQKEAPINYPYQYVKLKSKTKKFGTAIFSKYPIINSGSLNFKNTSNNAIFADILKGTDTIRVYNLHLQSLKINPNKGNFGQANSEKLRKRLSVAFTKQATQTQQFLAHEQFWKGKKIICGDLNNTAYSWVYKQISKGKKDAFVEAGSGFGKSFNYPFPVRIDFIFTDPNTQVNYFTTFSQKFSDHFPILARVNWNN